jgi:hypothetical protein
MEATLLVCTLTLDSLPEDTVAIRSIVCSDKDLIYEYYATIVGVKHIEIESIAVPATFQATLIGPVGDPELTYPAYDIAVLKTNVPSYNTLIQHAITGERLRVNLSSTSPVLSVEYGTLSEKKQQLFESLHHVASVLESYAVDGKAPDIVAWILSPQHHSTRDANGIKFITDPVIGSKWDSLLGTSLFPDFLISRRISSASWTFQHPTTTAMLRSIVEWWAAAHMRSNQYWIHSSEIELDSLLNIFRSRGIPTEYHSEKMDAIKTAMLEIEETVLGHPDIYSSTDLIPLQTADQWRLWVDRMFRYKRVLLDSNVEFVQAMITRWMRDGWGLRKECLPSPPAAPQFKEAWESLVRLRSVHIDSIMIWVRLLNINDPIYTIRVRHEPKQQILDDWIPVAIQYLKASHPLIRGKSNSVYAWIRTWMLRYVPEALFKTFMLPKRMHPSIILSGYTMIHSTTGYFFVGLELPESYEEVVPWVETEEID